MGGGVPWGSCGCRVPGGGSSVQPQGTDCACRVAWASSNPPPPVLHITGDLTQQEGRSPDVIPGPGQLLPRSRLALSGRRGALNTATKGVFMNR